MVTKEERGVGGIHEGFSISRYTLLYIKQITRTRWGARELHTIPHNNLHGKKPTKENV